MTISDNYNMDTTQVTMMLFARADLLIQQHQYERANQTFDSINSGMHWYVVLIAAALLFAPLGALPWGIILLAVLSAITVAQRARHVMRQL
jgi:hypothetical protein